MCTNILVQEHTLTPTYNILILSHEGLLRREHTHTHTHTSPTSHEGSAGRGTITTNTPRLRPTRGQPVEEQSQQTHSSPTSHEGSAGRGTSTTNTLLAYVPRGVSRLRNNHKHTPRLRPMRGQPVEEQSQQTHSSSTSHEGSAGQGTITNTLLKHMHSPPTCTHTPYLSHKRLASQDTYTHSRPIS